MSTEASLAGCVHRDEPGLAGYVHRGINPPAVKPSLLKQADQAEINDLGYRKQGELDEFIYLR
jgi:hypothetical protein